MSTNVAAEERAAGKPEPEPAVAAATYRPQLDGLRALAVYLVVLYHSGSGVFPGGYVGVDVFFVLSGYLVTQLLLRDVARTGSIRFGRFYARRFRRLLPAAFVALIVTALVFTAIASPAAVIDAVGSFKAAFLYVTNWYFIHQSHGYFGADLTANPVLQFWSLAIEEQFYLLWPLTLAAGFALTRRMERARQMQVIRIAVVLGAIASAVWALSLRSTDLNRAYYGTDTRAYELFAGAFIALTPVTFDWARRLGRWVRIAAVVSIAVVVLLASSWVSFGPIVRGIIVTIAVALLIVALESAGGGIVVRALSNRTVVYLGKISYGTYLWHWIVILVIAHSFHISTVATIAIASLVATALASLSYDVLEQPVRLARMLDRHRGIVIASGLAISLLSALVLIPRIVKPASAGTQAAVHPVTDTGFTPVPPGLDWQHADAGQRTFVSCIDADPSKCTIAHGSGPSVMIIGDSHAQMIVPAFLEIARHENLTLSVSTLGLCPWALGNSGPGGASRGKPELTTERCHAFQEDTFKRVIPALHPDLIVATDLGYGTWTRGKVKSATDALRATGAKVLLVEPTPGSVVDPRVCLSSAKSLEACRYVVSTQPGRLELFYRSLAKRDRDVNAMNMDKLVCPFLPICDPVINNTIVKWDYGHITYKYSQSLAPQFDDYLKQIGFLPGVPSASASP